MTDAIACGINLLLQADYLAVVARSMLRQFENSLETLPVTIALQADYAVIWSKKWPLATSAQRFIEVIKFHCATYDWQKEVMPSQSLHSCG